MSNPETNPDGSSEPIFLPPSTTNTSDADPDGGIDADVEVRSQRARGVGPGIWESIGWCLALLLGQVIIGALVSVFAVFAHFSSGGSVADLQREVQQAAVEKQNDVAANPDNANSDNANQGGVANPPPSPPGRPPGFMKRVSGMMPIIMVLVGAFNITLGLLLCRFRLGKREFHAMGWQLPSVTHLLIMALLIVPLSIVATTIQIYGFRWFPSAQTEMMELMNGLKELPFAVVFFLLAVLPALGEEFVFRGPLGRGLLSRYGWLRGFTLTSVLFAVIHMNPAQVLGVLPLGLMIHCVYASSRSFWGAVLVHLGNNGLAAALLKYGDRLPMRDIGSDGQIPWDIALAAVVTLGFLAHWLWTARVKFLNDVEEEWTSPDANCGVPPEHGYRPVCQATPPYVIAGALVSELALLALLFSPLLKPAE